MFEMTCPPNGRVPVPHYHRDWDETIYGLSGVVTWTVDGKVVEIGPGDTVFIRRGVVHGFDNRSSVPARCLCVLTPGVLGPEFFREVVGLEGIHVSAKIPKLKVVGVAVLKDQRRANALNPIVDADALIGNIRHVRSSSSALLI